MFEDDQMDNEEGGSERGYLDSLGEQTTDESDLERVERQELADITEDPEAHVERHGDFKQEDVSAGALMYQANSEMARSSIRDMSDAKRVKQVASKQKLEAKQAQIDATAAEIDAKREAAGEALTAASRSSTTRRLMPCCARNIGKDGHCKSRTVLLHILSERHNTVQRIGSI